MGIFNNKIFSDSGKNSSSELEFNTFPSKDSLVDNDIFLIEDSEDNYNKKKVLKSNLEVSADSQTETSFLKKYAYIDVDRISLRLNTNKKYKIVFNSLGITTSNCALNFHFIDAYDNDLVSSDYSYYTHAKGHNNTEEHVNSITDSKGIINPVTNNYGLSSVISDFGYIELSVDIRSQNKKSAYIKGRYINTNGIPCHLTGSIFKNNIDDVYGISISLNTGDIFNVNCTIYQMSEYVATEEQEVSISAASAVIDRLEEDHILPLSSYMDNISSDIDKLFSDVDKAGKIIEDMN